MNAIKKLEVPRDPVPIELWGKDHWTTLAYIETRCVDYDGVPNHDHSASTLKDTTACLVYGREYLPS
jgi:hypothetical protein